MKRLLRIGGNVIAGITVAILLHLLQPRLLMCFGKPGMLLHREPTLWYLSRCHSIQSHTKVRRIKN